MKWRENWLKTIFEFFLPPPLKDKGSIKGKNLKIIFDQFSRHSLQFWTTLIFFMFGKKCFTYPIFFSFFLGGGGLKIKKLFSTNFLAISCHFEQLWFFFTFPGWGWVGWVGENKIKANLSFSLGLAELGKKSEKLNNNRSDQLPTSDLPFFDSGNFFQICQFAMNDPIKWGGGELFNVQGAFSMYRAFH